MGAVVRHPRRQEVVRTARDLECRDRHDPGARSHVSASRPEASRRLPRGQGAARGRGTADDPDGAMKRCSWPGDDELYVRYHDQEWGRPVSDDRRLFEKVCLEGFQSGLSWITILRKRDNFREAFAGFDPAAVARFSGRDVTRLLKNAGIIRHRGKIESTINNARRA